MSDVGELYRQAMWASVVGLVINLMLGIVKLVAGIVAESSALLSDAVNSLGDSLTSVVVLIALRYSKQPADEEHPYGHTRLESVAASQVALVVLLSALYIGVDAAFRLNDPHAIPPIWTLWIAAINVVIKEGLYRYKVRVAERTGSVAMVANAWDHRSDAFCSLAVLVGLSVVRISDARFIWADEVAAMVVVGVICWSAGRVLKQSVSDLLDPQADDAMVSAIRLAAYEIEGVRWVEKLWVRKTGIEYLADIHLQVDGELSVAEGHRIGHRVKDLLVARFVTLRDVLVHLEPFSGGGNLGLTETDSRRPKP